MQKPQLSLAALTNLTDERNKQSRLDSILQSWKEHPGRAPNGTGDTGLMSTDSQGFSQMLNDQTEALNLQNELRGKAPMTVREAPMVEHHFDSAGYIPQSQDYKDAEFSNPYSVDEIRRKGSLGALQRLVS